MRYTFYMDEYSSLDIDATKAPLPLLEVAHVTREFSLRRGFMQPPLIFKAVDDVSFTIRRGETLGLVGESGCGKSTLARMIVRLLAVSSGQICFEGQDIRAPKPCGAELGVAPQGACPSPNACVPIPSENASVPMPSGNASVPMPSENACVPIPSENASVPIPSENACVPVPSENACVPMPLGNACVPMPLGNACVPMPLGNASVPMPSENASVPEARATWAMRMQMVFQDPFSSFNPRLPVGYSIAEPLLAAGIPKAERSARVATMLERVGLLPEHAARYPHAFSGGQRQRLAIARAIITPPSLVVCDEAVSALDASVQAQVLNVLKDVQDAFGLSYLFISHDLAVIGHMSDRIAVMYLGRIVEIAPSANIFSHALHPYTQALLNSVLVHDPERPRLPESLQGELPSLFAPPSGCPFHPRCPLTVALCREVIPPLRMMTEGHHVACHQTQYV